MDLMGLTDKAERVARQGGCHCKIVGRWIWADFADKPEESVRDMMLAEGFYYNRKRNCWQFAGIPCGSSPAGRWAIEAKYGAVEVDELKGAAVA